MRKNKSGRVYRRPELRVMGTTKETPWRKIVGEVKTVGKPGPSKLPKTDKKVRNRFKVSGWVEIVRGPWYKT